MKNARIMALAVLLSVSASPGLSFAQHGRFDRYAYADMGKSENEADTAERCEAARLKWQSENPMYKTVLWTGRVPQNRYGKTDRCELRYYGSASDIAYVQAESPIQWDMPVEGDRKCGAAVEKWMQRHREIRDARWTGEWVSIEPSQASACIVEYSTRSPNTVLHQFKSSVRTGVFQQVCEPARQAWQKKHPQYRTVLWTGYGRFDDYTDKDTTYTCEFRYSTGMADSDYIEAGPIFVTHNPAERCASALKQWQSGHREAINVKWTGKWMTTVPDKMSVCEITYSTKPE